MKMKQQNLFITKSILCILSIFLFALAILSCRNSNDNGNTNLPSIPIVMLMVDGATPSNGSVNIAVDSNINLTFNQNISDIDMKDITITLTAGALPPVMIDTNQFNINGNVLTINPTYSLVANAEYTIKVQLGSIVLPIYTFTTSLQQQKLTAGEDAVAKDKFGHSVSISGDYAIVGAPNSSRDPSDSNKTGAAYIFHFNGSTWVTKEQLTTDDATTAGDNFGWSVSINRDGTYAIVGAHKRIGRIGSGTIFKRNDNAWIQNAIITGDSDSTSRDSFGTSVYLDDNHAIIGVPFEDNASNSAGSAYIFRTIRP